MKLNYYSDTDSLYIDLTETLNKLPTSIHAIAE